MTKEEMLKRAVQKIVDYGEAATYNDVQTLKAIADRFEATWWKGDPVTEKPIGFTGGENNGIAAHTDEGIDEGSRNDSECPF